MAASIASLGLPKRAGAQSAPSLAPPQHPILFTNFRLFDGKSGTLREGLRLLVEGNRIKAVAAGNPPAPDDAQVIDCGGRVLMPGLIDAHWHSIFAALPLPTLLSADVGYIFLAASQALGAFGIVLGLPGSLSRQVKRMARLQIQIEDRAQGGQMLGTRADGR